MKFEIFRGDAYNQQETIALFRRARVVIGTHGAGLANVVYAAPGTALLEVALATPRHRDYMHLAMSLGHAYWLVDVVANSLELESEIALDVAKAAGVLVSALDAQWGEGGGRGWRLRGQRGRAWGRVAGRGRVGEYWLDYWLVLLVLVLVLGNMLGKAGDFAWWYLYFFVCLCGWRFYLTRLPAQLNVFKHYVRARCALLRRLRPAAAISAAQHQHQHTNFPVFHFQRKREAPRRVGNRPHPRVSRVALGWLRH